jgi:hypothetical protein
MKTWQTNQKKLKIGKKGDRNKDVLEELEKERLLALLKMADLKVDDDKLIDKYERALSVSDVGHRIIS